MNMSMVNMFRHILKISMNPNLHIYRYQSQKILDLLDKKTPVEIEQNDELENLPCENTIEWNKKLKFYRIRGEPLKAIKLFEIGIRKYQYQPDYITYVSMIELCKDTKDLENGRYVHRIVNRSNVRENSRIQTILMELYMKCGDVDSARDMFNILKNRTVIEYNALMTAYNTHNYCERTIDLFNEMRQQEQVKANNVTYLLYIQACISLKFFDKGKAIHEELIQKSPAYIKNKELINQLISMYIIFDDYKNAEELFNQIKEPSIRNYVSFMNYYNKLNNWEKTFQLYDQLKKQKKIQIDVPTYLAVLTAVKQSNNMEIGKQIQADILKQNLWHNHVEIEKLLKDIFK